MEPVVIFRIIMAVIGFGGMIISYRLAKQLQDDAQSSLVHLQLNPDRTTRQFELILGFVVLGIVALVVYLLGAFFVHQTILTVGRALIVLAAIPICYVAWQWWQVF